MRHWFRFWLPKFSLIASLSVLFPNTVLSLPFAFEGEYVVSPFQSLQSSGSTGATDQAELVTWIGEPDTGGAATKLYSFSGPQASDSTPEKPSTIVLDHERAKLECDALLRARGQGIGEGWHCEPNFVVSVSAIPEDPLYSQQPPLNFLELPKAWDTTTGSSEVLVAVLDTGIDYTHPDLADNMWQNEGEIPGNGIDDDGNGYIDDRYGIDSFSKDSDPRDDNGHGTHCAGIIGAVGNNQLGVSGVSWNVKLMALKFLGANGGGSIFDAITAIRYAIDHGAQVINASFGSPYPSLLLEDAMYEAGEAGVLFVAAAGNSASNNDELPEFPASSELENVVSVAAADGDGNLAWFSNYGNTSVDLAAPGTLILSTVPGSQYARFSGTSMAAPHVAGVAALLLSQNSDQNILSLKQQLLETTVRSQTLTNLVRTAGALNAYRAVSDIRDQLPTAPPPAPPQLTEPSNAVRITQFRTNTHRRRLVKRGGRFRFSIRGKAFQRVELSFELQEDQQSVTCNPWRTVLNKRGIRKIAVRVPRILAADKLVLKANPGSNARQLKILGKQKGKNGPLSKGALLQEHCQSLTNKVRLR